MFLGPWVRRDKVQFPQLYFGLGDRVNQFIESINKK